MAEPQDRAVRRRAGRPPRALLGTDKITRAALKLVELEGYRGLTMAALARRLNVAPSALYNHVRSKQDVLLLVEEDLMGRVEVSGFATDPWPDAVRAWAWSYRNVFARHAPLIPVIAVLPVTDAPRTLMMYEAVTTGFARAGWPEDQIVDAIVALESFIFGSALDVGAPADIFDTGTLAAQTPSFTAAVRRRAAAAQDNGAPGAAESDRAFALGLEALLAGLSAGLAPGSAGAPG
ncbi:MAG: TetR family transcriptional regulator [Micrococcaceae bacterium]|nr:TetR family transcriptional regulator [Micrococcaceae bacterium]